METEHTETVVEKVTSYVKDMLGIHPAENAPEAVAKPPYGDLAPALHFDDGEPALTPVAPEPTTEDALRIEPRAFSSAAELNAESARREDGE